MKTSRDHRGQESSINIRNPRDFTSKVQEAFYKKRFVESARRLCEAFAVWAISVKWQDSSAVTSS